MIQNQSLASNMKKGKNHFCAINFQQILYWTIAANLFLVVLKLLGGILSKSSGLMADALESTSILISSIFILFCISNLAFANDTVNLNKENKIY